MIPQATAKIHAHAGIGGLESASCSRFFLGMATPVVNRRAASIARARLIVQPALAANQRRNHRLRRNLATLPPSAPRQFTSAQTLELPLLLVSRVDVRDRIPPDLERFQPVPELSVGASHDGKAEGSDRPRVYFSSTVTLPIVPVNLLSPSL
jgi:hypothetical protein